MHWINVQKWFFPPAPPQIIHENALSFPWERGEGGRSGLVGFNGQHHRMTEVSTSDDDCDLCSAGCTQFSCSYCLQFRSCSHLHFFRVRGAGIYWRERICSRPKSKCYYCLCCPCTQSVHFHLLNLCLSPAAGSNQSHSWNLARRLWLTLSPHFLCKLDLWLWSYFK